jgi:hypothetical protein
VNLRRVVVGLLAMMLGAAVLSVLPSSPLARAAVDSAQSDSAVTVSGNPDGPFAKLNVTVSQTKNLINQTVKVSWTGATPTVNPDDFLINYLQIMQCWGDAVAGPDRTQCQYGGLFSSGGDTPGPWVLTRQVSTSVADPKEPLKRGTDGSLAYVPFWPADRPQPTGSGTGNINDFFDSQVTNEIPLARTHGDGTGKEFFEVQTVTQAAGLGCGEPITTDGVTKGRSCWLVVVPRGNTEVDGTIRDGTNNSQQLQSSPLSESNWQNRIAIPLEFQPVGQRCPIGAPERPLIGHELAVDAVSSWQPALCAGGGSLFSYTQLPDDVARSQVPDGRLALVTNPIPPDQVSADHPLIYAPVGLSGLAIAFNVEHQPPHDASPADLELNGLRFTSMKLTPRLVAKLLTQSYRSSVEAPDVVKDNPPGLLFDPEFLALNHEYEGFVNPTAPAPDALVQINGADVTSLLWSWVVADPDARAFLAGTAALGMKINPNNKDLILPTSTFPRNDQSCVDSTSSTITLRTCNLDTHPYTKDMHDAGRAASRGDTEAQRPTDVGGGAALPKAVPRQTAGRRGLLAVVDAATAARYGLPTAQLLNASGQFVAPTTESVLAGEAAMKPSAVTGVLASDPGASDPNAYPLTALSYAVTAPSMLDAAAGKDYAAFLRQAGGLGQQPGIEPGNLPAGMVPLPDSLKAQTIAAAAAIEAQTREASSSPQTSPLTITGSTTVPRQNSTGGPSAPAGTGGTAANQAGGTPAATPANPIVPGSGPPIKGPGVAQEPVAGVRRTPALPAPAVGVLLGAVLVVGAFAAAYSPATRLLGGWLRRHWRRGVEPSER